MKLYALPGLVTYHELIHYPNDYPEDERPTRVPHLKCDPRKLYNDLMTVVDAEVFEQPHPTVMGIGRVFLCSRCFRVKKFPG